MRKGYVKLYRKSLDSGLIRNHKAWILFTYCLLKATHKKRKAVIGRQQFMLFPGQFVFGRRVAAEETGLTEQQIRTALQTLKTLQILTIQSTNKFSIITIINWSNYQAPEPEVNQQSIQNLTSNQPQTKKEECKKDPPDFFTLKKRYSNPHLIDQCFAAIASTRKSGKVADSVLLAQLQKWDRFPAEQVEAGIRTYLAKDYAGQGKGENYLFGIIRNHNGDGHPQQSQHPEPPQPKFYSANDPESLKELYSNG